MTRWSEACIFVVVAKHYRYVNLQIERKKISWKEVRKYVNQDSRAIYNKNVCEAL